MKVDELTGKVTPHLKGREGLCGHTLLLHLHGHHAQPHQCLLYQRAGLEMLPLNIQDAVDSILRVLLGYNMEEEFFLGHQESLGEG